MKLGYSELIINPIKETRLVGMGDSKPKANEIEGDLYVRCIIFNEGNRNVAIISLDSLAISYNIAERVKENIIKSFDLNIEVVISCTHTHYAPSILNHPYLCRVDEEYLTLLSEKIIEVISKCVLNMKENINIRYNYCFFDEIGKSRITGLDSKNIFLQRLDFFSDKENIVTIVLHNCHPTILSVENNKISSEYPGETIEKLKARNKDTFFMFLQGAAGDISTRTTRRGQDYNEVNRMANILTGKVMELDKGESEPIINMSLKTEIFNINHNIKTLENFTISQSISNREKETIQMALGYLQELGENKEYLDNKVRITKVKLNDINLVFNPCELFSSYLNNFDVSNTMVIGYSDGYLGYILDKNVSDSSYEYIVNTISMEETNKIIENMKLNQ